MKINMAVFFGCRSVEHEVSIISAVQAMRAVDKEKYNVIPVYVAKNGTSYTGDRLFDIENYKNMESLLTTLHPVTLLRENDRVVMRFLDNKLFKKNEDKNIDICFPIVHGTNCEDGTLAGYFEYLGVPYISCDIISAAVGMDKKVFKDVLAAHNLPMLDCICFTAKEYRAKQKETLKKIKDEIGFPLIVKPVNLGSSVGISKVYEENKLAECIDLAVSFADKVLVEKAVENLREINCSVLGNTDECEASVLEEPVMSDDILSFSDKYLKGGKKQGGEKQGMASLSRKIPADLDSDKTNEIKDLSKRIFKALGCSGVVRIDYLMNDKTGEVFANEINTIPGSLAFYLWRESGIEYKELIDRLVDTAFYRQRKRDNLTFVYESNILESANIGGAKGTKGKL
ncbi:MAG: D-alanine--D-alanine ligase [Clostridia bacterium]|nr:D-alanine--D-alanine ligase [Clostridia bacterium]